MSTAGRFATPLLALFLTFTVSPTDAAIGPEGSHRTTTVRIAIVSKSTLDLPFWVARERGFFRDEGLDAEIVLMRSNLTLQAMTAGGVEFGTATARRSTPLWLAPSCASCWR